MPEHDVRGFVQQDLGDQHGRAERIDRALVHADLRAFGHREHARTLNDLPEIGIIRSHYSGTTGLGIRDLDGVSGTAYGLFNAITQFESHDAGRAKDETERARTRLEALWGGTSAKRIERAREACLALV